MKSLLLAGGLFSILTSCGIETKSKESQAEDFYEETLHLKDQRECNAKGFLYNNIDAVCTDTPLATWACSREGLVSQMGQLAKSNESLAEIDKFIADGYQFVQCGETDKYGFRLGVIVFHRKTIEGDMAKASARQIGVALDGDGRLVDPDAPSSSPSGADPQTNTESTPDDPSVDPNPSSQDKLLKDFSSDAEVFFLGAYTGVGHQREFQQPATSPGKISVNVKRTSAPVILMLSSYESVEWTVTADPGVTIEGVIVSSYHESGVKSLPASDIPVFLSSYEKDWKWERIAPAGVTFSYFYAYEDDLDCASSYSGSDWKKTSQLAMTLTGKTIAGAQGTYTGSQFTVDSFSQQGTLSKAADCN